MKRMLILTALMLLLPLCALAVVTVPASVTEVGDEAFADTAIDALIVPSAVTRVGAGVLRGPDAVQQFNGLAVLMAVRERGELYHPVWGTTSAMLTELEMSQNSRPDYIEYSFTFRETDEMGMIPKLPEIENRYN